MSHVKRARIVRDNTDISDRQTRCFIEADDPSSVHAMILALFAIGRYVVSGLRLEVWFDGLSAAPQALVRSQEGLLYLIAPDRERWPLESATITDDAAHGVSSVDALSAAQLLLQFAQIDGKLRRIAFRSSFEPEGNVVTLTLFRETMGAVFFDVHQL